MLTRATVSFDIPSVRSCCAWSLITAKYHGVYLANLGLPFYPPRPASRIPRCCLDSRFSPLSVTRPKKYRMTNWAAGILFCIHESHVYQKKKVALDVVLPSSCVSRMDFFICSLMRYFARLSDMVSVNVTSTPPACFIPFPELFHVNSFFFTCLSSRDLRF